MRQFIHDAEATLKTRYDEREIRAICKCLLQHYTACSSSDFYIGKDINISQEQRGLLQTALQALSQGEPLQYVLGVCEFYGHPFKLIPPVLIPRPETEELVDWVVKEQAARRGRLLDVGCGSGCIAISLALHTAMQVEAWDVLPQALECTKVNADALGAKVLVRCCDLFRQSEIQPSPSERYELIVSNPPYICESQAADMQDNVLEHESHLALFVPDDDALRYYEALAQLGKRRLLPGGCIYVEINELFGEQTAAVFRRAGYATTLLHRDLSGRDRMIKACL